MNSFTLPSLAKLNWHLQVLGKRPDGYHELSTIFQTISLGDRISFAPGAGGGVMLECDDPGLSVGPDNLILRAAEALRRISGCKEGAVIRLEKRIPAGGGLGGGSSNAAVTLLGLMRLWDLRLDGAQLAELATGLGADVPFFLFGGTAWGRGVGDELEPIQEIEVAHLLVVSPGVSVSTRDAFKAMNLGALTKNKANAILSVSYAGAGTTLSLPEVLFNDLEAVVFKMVPQVERAKKSLELLGARGALMSGSGSSVFGIFENRGSLELAARELEREKGWRVFSCSTVARQEYRRMLGSCATFLRI